MNEATTVEARKLIHTRADLEPASRSLVDARLGDIYGRIAAREMRLAEVERQIEAMDESRSMPRWSPGCSATSRRSGAPIAVQEQALFAEAVDGTVAFGPAVVLQVDP